MAVNPNRIKELNKDVYVKGKVVYWMSRDQRVKDNWALIHAADLANQYQVPLTVIFVLPNFEQVPTLRRYWFLIEGLKFVERGLKKHGVSFEVFVGESASGMLSRYIQENNVGQVVADFCPLQKQRIEQLRLSKNQSIPMCVVDAHNIVPCWVASDKEEYSAYTFRKKITPLIETYLEPFPALPKLEQINNAPELVDWGKIYELLEYDSSVKKVKGIKPGSLNAEKRFREFLKKEIEKYDKHRNKPNKYKTSRLSPYINFGQISAQYMAGKILKKVPEGKDKDAFLEQLIVRRELSDNYCFYNTNYDNAQGFRGWVKDTYETHKDDEREYVYTPKQFEKAQTHDSLWNAAQNELVRTGVMHGYMRMYWAKKILEWCEFPETAMKIAVYLNDKYALDGHSPNGYVGCAWAIGGVHDRPWKERPVIGKIRYMNYKGCKRKFNVEQYISAVEQL